MSHNRDWQQGWPAPSLPQTVFDIFAFHVSPQDVPVNCNSITKTVKTFTLFIQVIASEPAVGTSFAENCVLTDVPVDSFLGGPACLTYGALQTRVEVICVLRCKLVENIIVCAVHHCLCRLGKIHDFFFWTPATLSFLGTSSLSFGFGKIIYKLCLAVCIVLQLGFGRGRSHYNCSKLMKVRHEAGFEWPVAPKSCHPEGKSCNICLSLKILCNIHPLGKRIFSLKQKKTNFLLTFWPNLLRPKDYC